MRLESLETFIVGTPPPGFGGRYFIFVRLKTACGITGVGEIYAASFAPEVVCQMAGDMFQRYLEGMPPDRISGAGRMDPALPTVRTHRSRASSADWKWPVGTLLARRLTGPYMRFSGGW
jgi:L-alanine-DL-glutamate epimerase-like enolase superfamily enzyme